jgi:hypothetical protein
LLQTICKRLEDESNPEAYKNIQNLSNNISRQIKLLEVVRAALEQVLSHPEVSDSFYQLFNQPKQDSKLRRINSTGVYYGYTASYLMSGV